jgi:Protein of unknown function (DUF2934)
METQNEGQVGRPSQEAIAKRAYELFLQRGSVPGYELDDWLQAEAELTAAAASAQDTDSDESDAQGQTARQQRAESRRSSPRERSSGRRTLRP